MVDREIWPHVRPEKVARVMGMDVLENGRSIPRESQLSCQAHSRVKALYVFDLEHILSRGGGSDFGVSAARFFPCHGATSNANFFGAEMECYPVLGPSGCIYMA